MDWDSAVSNSRPSRFRAFGFDFAVEGIPERAIEVKGMKGDSGAILFTDREWSKAKVRQAVPGW